MLLLQIYEHYSNQYLYCRSDSIEPVSGQSSNSARHVSAEPSASAKGPATPLISSSSLGAPTTPRSHRPNISAKSPKSQSPGKLLRRTTPLSPANGDVATPLIAPSSPYPWSFPTPEQVNTVSPKVIQKNVSARSLMHPNTAEDKDTAAASAPIQRNSEGKIVGITPARLVILLTLPESLDYNLLSDVFLCYRQFVSPLDLLRLLRERFKWAVSRIDDIGRTVRLRTFVVLRHWLLNYFAHDFVPSMRLRQEFVAVVNNFCRYGKVRSSNGDRRLLGELKRCWIRLSYLYWDFTLGMYGADFLSLTSDQCFDQELHPGGTIGTRKIDGKQTIGFHKEIDSLGKPLISDQMPDPYSSPILERLAIPHASAIKWERTSGSAASAILSVPSLSSGSVVSSNEPKTPLESHDTYNQPWGSLIRGEGMVSTPTDDQAIVNTVRPPSPAFNSLNDLDCDSHLYSAQDFQKEKRGHNIFKSIANKMKKKRASKSSSFSQRLQPSSSSETRDSRIDSNGVTEDSEVRIDILAASVVDNYKHIFAQNSTYEDRSYDSVPFQSVGLAVQNSDISAMLQRSPERQMKPTFRDASDVESLRGVEIYYHNPRDSLDSSMPSSNEVSGDMGIFSRVDERTLPHRILTYSNENALTEGSLDIDNRRDSILFLPSFPPSSSDDSRRNSAQISQPTNSHGLQRQNAIGNLKAAGSITHQRHISSSSSSLGASVFDAEVTSFHLNSSNPTSSPQPMSLLSSEDHSISSSRNRYRDVNNDFTGIPGIPGIPDEMARELMKLAELSSEEEPAATEAEALERTLQKLEGKSSSTAKSLIEKQWFDVHSTISASAGSQSSSSPYKQRRSERNAWFVDANSMLGSVPMQKDILRLQNSEANSMNAPSLSATEQSFVSSKDRSSLSSYAQSYQSSTVSLRIHLPFILKYRARDLAEQFTLIDRDALAEIDWKELVELRWQQNVAAVQDWASFISSEEIRGVELIITRFNLMTSWVTSEILLTRASNERVQVIQKFIHIAAHSRKLQNFSTVMQITLALASPTVQRLTKTWSLLPVEDQALFQELENIASPLRNFRSLRAEIDKADVSKGCIPFIGKSFKFCEFHLSAGY